jgi:hypothetical protein
MNAQIADMKDGRKERKFHQEVMEANLEKMEPTDHVTVILEQMIVMKKDKREKMEATDL